MDHIILFGDSIFDNKVYVPDGPAVVEQVAALFDNGTKVSLLAVDGDITSDVKEQIKKIPDDASHLFLSVGGNDALQAAWVFADDTLGSQELMVELTAIQKEFRRNYRKTLEMLLALNKPLAVCTIYDSVPNLEPQLVTALSIFNDVIISEASAKGIPIIDLRKVCNEEIDYSEISPIEPSSHGGQKIASSIVDVFRTHNFNTNNSAIFGG